ncbi:MAG: phospholipid carrier-dependent glycosyltransferase [Chlorobi bacterium]|nr:phospholipid carrier-dependent glycosyltransferase [Chlorobiota bacterium]
MPDEKRKIFYDEIIFLALIVFSAFFVRLYFVGGLIFSDDAYYNYLAQSFLNGKFAYNYIGYPIFLTRVLQTLLTAFSFSLFGVNEFSAIVFPFLFSLANIPLLYLIAFELTESKKIALMAALIMAFFPTDVIFAGINFVDLQSAFLINVGIYFLIKSVKNGKRKHFFFRSCGILFLFLVPFQGERLFSTHFSFRAIRLRLR